MVDSIFLILSTGIKVEVRSDREQRTESFRVDVVSHDRARQHSSLSTKPKIAGCKAAEAVAELHGSTNIP